MFDRGDAAQGSHIGAEFRERFRTFDDLSEYFSEHDVPLRFQARVIRQIAMEDFALGVAYGMGTSTAPARPVVVGSGTTHMREHGGWPPGMDFDSGGLPDAYAGAREAADIDLFFPGIPDGTEYASRGRQAISDAVGPGLGGLLDYQVSGIESDEDGHTVATITATPANTPGADALVFEIDLKSPHSQKHIVEDKKYGGFDASAHHYTPVELPGFRRAEFRVPPPEFMLADMLTLSTGPRVEGASERLDGPWFRPKDLYPVYQMVSTGRIDGERLRYALENNANRPLNGPVVPAEFDVHGRTGQSIYGRNGLAEWESGVDSFRKGQPDLGEYPSAAEMLTVATAFVRGLDEAGSHATWHDGTWHRADGSPVPAVAVPEPVRSVAYDARKPETGVKKLRSPLLTKYARGKEPAPDKLDSFWSRSRAVLNAAKRSWQYSKTMVEGAWKQGGVTGPVVVSYGSARSQKTSAEYQQAAEFNYRMGQSGWIARTGGGPGVMEAANRGMSRAYKGNPSKVSLGVNLKLPWEQKASPFVDRSALVTAREFPERMELLRTGVHAFVAFRGGAGTVQEINDILGLMNTKKIPQAPVVFVDRKFWQGTRDQLEAMVEGGKVGREIFDTILFTDSVKDAADFVVKTHASLSEQRDGKGRMDAEKLPKRNLFARKTTDRPQARGASASPRHGLEQSLGRAKERR